MYRDFVTGDDVSPARRSEPGDMTAIPVRSEP
jgi:hypothetical protein